eukprot:6591147-Pyramimonas_sp.AAC.2
MAHVSPAAPMRVATPDIDPTFLGKELKKYVTHVGIKKSFNLHRYHYLTKTRAVHARSLHLMSPLASFSACLHARAGCGKAMRRIRRMRDGDVENDDARAESGQRVIRGF